MNNLCNCLELNNLVAILDILIKSIVLRETVDMCYMNIPHPENCGHFLSGTGLTIRLLAG